MNEQQKQKLRRTALKRQARHTVMSQPRSYFYPSAIMLALQLVLLGLEINAGGMLKYYLFSTADYTAQTGISLSENGVTAILRLEELGTLLALPVSFGQMRSFVLVHLIVLFAISPLMMGVLGSYYEAMQGRPRPLLDVFRWYLDVRLTLKAAALRLLLTLVKWCMQFAGMLPGLGLIIWSAGQNGPSAATLLSAWALMAAGAAAGYMVYTLILPSQYLLAGRPDTPLPAALKDGFRALAGRRREYWRFRLSYLGWYALVNISRGAASFFVFPYSELANLMYFNPNLDTVSRPPRSV